MTHVSLLETVYHPSKGYDFSDVLKMVRPLISKADLVIANLETVMAGDSLGITGYPEFNSPQILATNLKNAGIDVLTTANNHSFDRGVKGLKNTIKLLDSLGIAHTGTHLDTSASSRALIVNVKKLKIGIINYCYGINGDLTPRISKYINIIDTASIKKEISYLKRQKVHLIIASVHFGVENRSQPDRSQISLVRFLQKNGVSVVFGHHPHVLQPYMFDNTANFFVIFSLGNFLASQKSFNREFGGIADLVIRKFPHDKKACIESARIIPTTTYEQIKKRSKQFRILNLNQLDSAKNNSRFPETFLQLIDTLPSIKKHLITFDRKKYYEVQPIFFSSDSNR